MFLGHQFAKMLSCCLDVFCFCQASWFRPTTTLCLVCSACLFSILFSLHGRENDVILLLCVSEPKGRGIFCFCKEQDPAFIFLLTVFIPGSNFLHGRKLRTHFDFPNDTVDCMTVSMKPQPNNFLPTSSFFEKHIYRHVLYVPHRLCNPDPGFSTWPPASTSIRSTLRWWLCAQSVRFNYPTFDLDRFWHAWSWCITQGASDLHRFESSESIGSTGFMRVTFIG